MHGDAAIPRVPPPPAGDDATDTALRPGSTAGAAGEERQQPVADGDVDATDTVSD